MWQCFDKFNVEKKKKIRHEIAMLWKSLLHHRSTLFLLGQITLLSVKYFYATFLGSQKQNWKCSTNSYTKSIFSRQPWKSSKSFCTINREYQNIDWATLPKFAAFRIPLFTGRFQIKLFWWFEPDFTWLIQFVCRLLCFGYRRYKYSYWGIRLHEIC